MEKVKEKNKLIKRNTLFNKIQKMLENRKINELDNYNIMKCLDNNNLKDIVNYTKLLLQNMGLSSDKIDGDYIKNSLSIKITHTLFTFFLGLLISRFDDLEAKIEKEYEKYFNEKHNVFLKVWTITSIFHDYGYAYIKNNKDKLQGIEELSEINIDNNIFEFGDKTEQSRYSRDLFKVYFREFAKKEQNEKDEKNKEEYLEHGITGGYVLFDEIIKKNIILSDVSDNYFYQNICYRIMEHNIWKIKENNVFFKEINKKQVSEIYEDNFKVIYDNEPLLYLLSLCDTIEHVKRLYTKNNEGENTDTRVTTFAKKIGFEVNIDYISINYVEVKRKVELIYKKLTNEDNDNEFEKWKRGIKGLNEWVNVDVKDNGKEWIIFKKN